MRRMMDAGRLDRFMRRLAEESSADGRVYFTGGATALLLGWRSTTIDVDLKIEQEGDRLLQAIPRLKEELAINVELACPSDFIPELPGWRDRSVFIRRDGRIDYFHYDLYAQALAKLERGHRMDLADVRAMVDRKLIEPGRALDLFRQIEPLLYRFPAIDPRSFRKRVEEFLGPVAPAPTSGE